MRDDSLGAAVQKIGNFQVATDLLSVSRALNRRSTSSDETAFPNALSQFVFTRTYPRWREEDRRRETFTEAVDRYVGFLRQQRDVPPEVLEDIRSAILRMDVLPSMRAFWSAGPSMEYDNTGCYNCAFVPIDSLMSFAELLYVLMMGTGIGYSVERLFVDNLPVVALDTGEPPVKYVIEDSTVGWKNALYDGLVHLFSGRTVDYDFSRLRKAGTRLRTKGGRASGPGPLKALLAFVQRIVRGAAGRKLKSIECHDIACMVGDVTRSGGVRRAALISFSDPDDEDMRDAKKFPRCQICGYGYDAHLSDEGKGGHLEKEHGLTEAAYLEMFPGAYLGFGEHRYMSNNSTFWPSRPTRAVFDREWKHLVESGSGERGFFMAPSAKTLERRGEFRANPCVTGETRVMTEHGLVQIKDLVDRFSPVRVATDRRFGLGVSSLTDGPEPHAGAFRTGRKEVFVMKTVEGYTVRLTADHRVMTSDGWKEAAALRKGDLVHVANTEGMFGPRGSAAAGMIAGWLVGDGTVQTVSRVPRLYFHADKKSLASCFVDATEALTGVRPMLCEHADSDRLFFESRELCEFMGELLDGKERVPEFVWQGTRECQQSFLSALFSADGSVGTNLKKGAHLRLHSSSLPLLRQVQSLLVNFGIVSCIYEERRPAGYRDLPDGRGSVAPYLCRADHDLHISKVDLVRFSDRICLIHQEKETKLRSITDSYRRAPNRQSFTARFESLTPDGVEDVYDMTVPGPNSFVANGLVVHNCGEIGLRFRRSTDPWTGEGGGGQFCNLSAAVMRAHDTRESFAEKVRIAAWIGAIQSTFTYFPNLRPAWTELCNEDRLLGVDITGHCDNPCLSGDDEAMSYFNEVARQTADLAASYLGILCPAAVTCGKPSGNSSQFVDCASGFHPRWSQFYIRRVRISNKDPLFMLIRDQGVPVKKDVKFANVPDEECLTWVAEFPVAAPSGAMTRKDEMAIDQLERYLKVMQTWCGRRGHNQSATVYVRPEEWQPVADWVFEHFDEITGITFMPYDGGNYLLAPYEEITEDEYEKLVSEFPIIDYSLLSHYEDDDMGSGARELACSAGGCEIDVHVSELVSK